MQMKTAMVTVIHPPLPQKLKRFRKPDPKYFTVWQADDKAYGLKGTFKKRSRFPVALGIAKETQQQFRS